MRLAGLFKRLLRARAGAGSSASRSSRKARARPSWRTWPRSERRRLRCSRCGRSVRAVYDRSARCWRYLDLLRGALLLCAEVQRVARPDCRIVAEQVPRGPARIALQPRLRGHLRLARALGSQGSGA
jgi:hypothetical protein